MKLIDMHCDTISTMMQEENVNLKSNHLCVDLNKLRASDSLAQFFACYIYMNQFTGEDRFTEGYQKAFEMIARAKKEFADYADEISLARNYEELMVNAREGKISAILTVEEGGIIENDSERILKLYEEGIRLITLLWNGENCIGYPNSRDEKTMSMGLKPFGIETVERMNELGMIIDVSHLSDGGFWDVMKYSKKPVVASHSNARALCAHPRNLTDDMIRALAEKGGISGLNFYPVFMNGTRDGMIEDMVRHIEHMYYVGGEDFVAIGTDFDGYEDGEGSEIKHMGQMEYLYDALKKRKFNDSQIEKFWHKNVLRVIKEGLLQK